MSLFDPAAVSKQIDAIVATVPPGKHVTIVGNVDLMSRRANAAIVFKLDDTFSAYARVGKTFSGVNSMEADAGFRINFLFDAPPSDGFDYSELVEILRYRGQGWIEARLNALRLLRGREIRL